MPPVVPVLTSPTATATGTTTATIGVTSDTTGTAKSLRRVGGSQASAATIESTGVSRSVTAGVPFTVSETVPTTGVTYTWDWAQAGTSNVVSASATPSTLAIAGTALSAQSGTAGAAFTWAGSTPESLVTNTGNGSGGWTGTGLGASGLTVNGSTGVLQGTCGTAGTYNITLTRYDGSTVGGSGAGGRQEVTKAVTATIAAGSTPVSFSGTVPAQSATVGVAYSLALAGYFSGGLTPFAYTVFSGALPGGLTLNSGTGAVSGTPTTAGSFSAVVRATDTGSNTANTGTISFTVAATPPPGAYNATVGPFGEAGVQMSAGRTIYWTLQMGNGPGGLTGGAQGTATTDGNGNIVVGHSVAGAAQVTCSTTAPGTVSALRPVSVQLVTLV